MKANPGGQIDLNAVVGRKALLRTLWQTADQQSLIITAERRIGKTTVIKKMRQVPEANWIPVYQDLERCHTAAEFAMIVYKDIHQFLSQNGKVTRRLNEFLHSLGGTEIGGVLKMPEKMALPWKDVLTQAVEDLIHENEPNGKRLLFLWDEMPFMLINIRDREGEKTAMEVLDLLRALRQTHASLRMVMTGSVGLHHVLGSLKKKNYANSPMNDMVTVEVPPLTMPDAVDLATSLIDGEELKSSDKKAAAEKIASEGDCFPYYVHHIVRALKIQELDAEPANVEKVVASALVSANDPWELAHYKERILIYYGEDRNAVLLILDHLAAGQLRSSVNELLAMLKSASTFDDRERLLDLLSLMERDHYLMRDTEGRYGFRFPLIRRWWKINRGL